MCDVCLCSCPGFPGVSPAQVFLSLWLICLPAANVKGEPKQCCYKDLILGALFIVVFIELNELLCLVLNSMKNMFQLDSFPSKATPTILTLLFYEVKIYTYKEENLYFVQALFRGWFFSSLEMGTVSCYSCSQLDSSSDALKMFTA